MKKNFYLLKTKYCWGSIYIFVFSFIKTALNGCLKFKKIRKGSYDNY